MLAKKVLFVRQQPRTVDFSDLALPPGFDAATIHASVAVGMRQMAHRGRNAGLCLVRPDDCATPVLQQQIAAVAYGCVAAGAGIRIPPKRLLLSERLRSAVHRAAPKALILFSSVELAESGAPVDLAQV